mgnify:CR=1 FL=1
MKSFNQNYQLQSIKMICSKLRKDLTNYSRKSKTKPILKMYVSLQIRNQVIFYFISDIDDVNNALK